VVTDPQQVEQYECYVENTGVGLIRSAGAEEGTAIYKNLGDEYQLSIVDLKINDFNIDFMNQFLSSEVKTLNKDEVILILEKNERNRFGVCYLKAL
jgi:hypothetical protein